MFSIPFLIQCLILSNIEIACIQGVKIAKLNQQNTKCGNCLSWDFYVWHGENDETQKQYSSKFAYL